MKQFLSQNWYRLSISFSLLLFAFGFIIWSVKYNSARAGEPPHQYNNNFQPAEYYESNGSLYRLTYSTYLQKWQVKKILDFKEE
jgi:hypothetical protein